MIATELCRFPPSFVLASSLCRYYEAHMRSLNPLRMTRLGGSRISASLRRVPSPHTTGSVRQRGVRPMRPIVSWCSPYTCGKNGAMNEVRITTVKWRPSPAETRGLAAANCIARGLQCTVACDYCLRHMPLRGVPPRSCLPYDGAEGDGKIKRRQQAENGSSSLRSLVTGLRFA